MPEGSSAAVAALHSAQRRPQPAYVEAPIRGFAIATMFWGVVGFLVGVFIAAAAGLPGLNLGLVDHLRPAAPAAHHRR